MRFIAITRLMSPVPPEQLPSLMERFADWREQYREQLESFEFFSGSTGGFMVLDVPDEVVLNQIMAEYPLVAYLDVEVRPIIDGDTGLAQWWQVMRRMLGDAGRAEGAVEAGSTAAPPEVRQKPSTEPLPRPLAEAPPPSPPPDGTPPV
jgi:muconolactone delta-isomerase